MIVTPGAYGQLLISDDSDYVNLPSSSANVASRSLTQGTSAPIVEPDPDDLFVGLNGPVPSPLDPLDVLSHRKFLWNPLKASNFHSQYTPAF